MFLVQNKKNRFITEVFNMITNPMFNWLLAFNTNYKTNWAKTYTNGHGIVPDESVMWIGNLRWQPPHDLVFSTRRFCEINRQQKLEAMFMFDP